MSTAISSALKAMAINTFSSFSFVPQITIRVLMSVDFDPIALLLLKEKISSFHSDPVQFLIFDLPLYNSGLRYRYPSMHSWT